MMDSRESPLYPHMNIQYPSEPEDPLQYILMLRGIGELISSFIHAKTNVSSRPCLAVSMRKSRRDSKLSKFLDES
ncbi:hypothetical protein EUGRSUZ_E00751 [Eucalyptus grandis]|uniref:Uncharacterized protein n=2 Tax=Eucalyptus grandis TaxID=71139 RepID=A0ACC3KSN1_EUCGR|nr:hypothetical protein EUGRSUZ_E00751 [Eucalyptus grandis]